MFQLRNSVSVRPVTDQRIRRFVAMSHASMISIVAVGGTCLLSMIANVFYSSHLSGFPSDTSLDELEFERTTLVVILVGLAHIALWVVAATCFILWFRRAYEFVDELGGASREHGLSWTGWGFVVPVLSLWRPYGIMREIWDGFTEVWTQRPEISAQHKMPQRWIGSWWALYLVQAFASNAAFRVDIRSETVGDTLYAISFSVFSNVMTMLAVPPAVFVIHQTTRLIEPALRIGSIPPVPGTAEPQPVMDTGDASPRSN